jgi:hypothetical protein
VELSFDIPGVAISLSSKKTFTPPPALTLCGVCEDDTRRSKDFFLRLG